MANTLLIRLEGPMQSWGERARWSIRDSTAEPTKSGIVGLLACALGLKADDSLRQISQEIQMGIRVERPGVFLMDYHTISGGVLAANGRIKINANTRLPETVVTERTYLCDASFIVALQAKPEKIARWSDAVQNPIWPIYLGRKSCPPSRPVFEGVADFSTLESALENWPLYTRETEKEITVRIIVESVPGNGVRRRDEVDSNSRRTFLPRYVREYHYTLIPRGMEV
jgi:CRISPR system Cascade subunit CasD